MLSVCVLCFGLAPSCLAGGLTLSWSDNSENESGFAIERSTDGASFELLSEVEADVASFSDETVVPGVDYQYRVRAFNEFGYSGYTNVSSGAVPNSAPSLSEIEDVSLFAGAKTVEIEIHFSDSESPNESLQFELLSSNQDLLPLSGVDLQVTSEGGRLSVAPSAGLIGSSQVTLLVSDGVELAQSQFTLEVLPNTAPKIVGLGSYDTIDGLDLGPISFTVSDEESNPEDLVVTAISQNEEIIASEDIFVSGSGANRAISLRTHEGSEGQAVVRVEVTDGGYTALKTMVVDVVRNVSPSVTEIAEAYVLDAGASLSGIPFTVSDAETPSGELTVAVRSSQVLLLPLSGIEVEGHGQERVLRITPNPLEFGQAVVTLVISDGIKTTEHEILIQVDPPEVFVELVSFDVVDGYAAVEVANRPGAQLLLKKTHSLRSGEWEDVSGAEVVVGESTTMLIDPDPIAEPVCYRVFASH